LLDIEHGSSYDFHYMTHAINLNSVSGARSDEFNLYYIPTSFADGGLNVYVGSTQSQIEGIITASGNRAVPDVSMELTCNWLGGYQTEVIVTMTYHTLVNDAPGAPVVFTGPPAGEPGTEYNFETMAIDPDGNQFYARYAWGTSDTSAWAGPYNSGAMAPAAYTWYDGGTFEVTVQAKDIWDAESPWSAPHEITIENPWICGDVNGNEEGPNIADLSFLVQYLFGGGATPPNLQAANVDGDVGGAVNIADLSYLVQFLFGGGSAPIC
jgi:hypothetical protein